MLHHTDHVLVEPLTVKCVIYACGELIPIDLKKKKKLCNKTIEKYGKILISPTLIRYDHI